MNEQELTMIRSSNSVQASDIVKYNGEVWVVGETAIASGPVARLWPRQLKTTKDGREYVGMRDGVHGREGDVWAPVGKCEVIGKE
jgi:hypothetical protein